MDPAAFGQFLPLILIFAIMYFLLIRPQQKKVKEHQKMIEQLRVRDQVVTQGGMIGKVSKVKEGRRDRSGNRRRRESARCEVDHCPGAEQDRARVLSSVR